MASYQELLAKQLGPWKISRLPNKDRVVKSWRVNYIVWNPETGKVLAVVWNKKLGEVIAALGVDLFSNGLFRHLTPN